MAYRKLSKTELKVLYGNLRAVFDSEKEEYVQIKNLVIRYFKNAHSIIVNINSEYNDNDYDNRIAGVFVYDENDVECGLTREQRESFNDEFSQIDTYINTSEEELDDVVLYVSDKMPDIYIKE